MATVKQLPAVLDLEGVAGEPLTVQLTITGGHTISSPAVVLRAATGAATTVEPAVDRDGDVITITWSAADMTTLNPGHRVAQSYVWALRAQVNASGPYSLVARSLVVHPAGTADIATSIAESLAITVGGVDVTLPIVIDGAATIDLDAGSPAEVYDDTETIDGGDLDDEQTDPDIDGGTL